MYKVLGRLSLRSFETVKNTVGKRFFLSEAYKCSDAWKKRLDNNIFKEIDLENLYHLLDANFKAKTRVCVLDVDYFINSIKDDYYKNELEDILLKIRLCPECSILPERSTHAAIRWYMDNATKEELLNALSNRLDFGLFPDHYLTNLILNNFILKNDALSAVKIAVLQMLQEDFENPITKALAVYSCFFYLDSPDIWMSASKQETSAEEDEVVEKVRVRFIRNPYFDDHFDLTNPNYLVGKTLWMLGRQIDKPLATACELIGLVLYEKFDKSCDLLKEVVENKIQIHTQVVEKLNNYLSKPPKQIENEGDESVKSEQLNEHKQKMVELLQQIDQKNMIKGDFMEEVKNYVKKQISENEEKDIQSQVKLYQKWEEDRIKDFEEEVKRKEREEVIREIEQIKEDLKAEEEQLFYFDREAEIEIEIKQIEEKKKVEESKQKLLKHKELIKDDYVPPDVRQGKK